MMSERRKQSIRAKRARRALRLSSLGVCINGETHGPRTHGVRCQRCYERDTKRRTRDVSGVCDVHRAEAVARGRDPRAIRWCADCCAGKRPDRSYVPLDATLGSPAYRILSRLSRDSWVTSSEILDSLGVCEPVTEKQHYGERSKYTSAISRLTKKRCLERRAANHYRGMVEDRNEYRITALGRQCLSGLLRYDTGCVSDEEADLDAVVRVFGSLDVPELEAAA